MLLHTTRRDGATIPALAEFKSVLGLETTPFGWGLGDNIHAPNERMKVRHVDLHWFACLPVRCGLLASIHPDSLV